MARKEESGIKYFPVNTDMIHSDKIKLVVAEFGSKNTWAVLLPLYCKIYREKGYWIDWCNDDMKLLFAQDECKMQLSVVNELVNGFIRRSLFDKGVFEKFGILTSDRIQENYLEATKRRIETEVINEFILLDKDVIYKFNQNVNIIRLNVNSISKKVNISTQSKEDKINEKQIPNGIVIAGNANDKKQTQQLYNNLVVTLNGKEIAEVWMALKDFITQEKPLFIEPYQELWNLFAAKYKLARVEVINDSRRKKFKIRINEPAFDFIRILEKIRISNMLKGIDSNWKVTFDWIFENQNNYVKILEGNYD